MSNFNPHGRSADYKEVTVHLPVDQAAELAKIYEGNPPRLTYYGGAVSIQRSAAELARLLAARPAEEFRLVHVGDAVDIMDKFPAMLVFAHATTQQRGEPR